MTDRPTYHLTLKSEPNHGAPAARRMARALKSLLRQHGFRCVRIAQEMEGEITASDERESKAAIEAENAPAGG